MWLPILSLLLPIFSPAENLSLKSPPPTELAATYRKETRAVLEELEKAGITNIACLNFKADCTSPQQLIDLLERIAFIEDSGFTKPKGATRRMAFYSSEKNAIYLNTSVHHEKSIIGFVGFHELLGLSGRDDNEFMFSLPAHELLRSEIPLSEKYIHSLKGNIDSRPVSSSTSTYISEANAKLVDGGATLVGGGGDGASLEQRVLFARYFRKSVQQSMNTHGIENGIRVSIEVVDTKDKIEFLVPPETESGWPKHILVPRALTQLPPITDHLAPNRAIEEIGLYFASILNPSFFPQITKNWTNIVYFSRHKKINFMYPDKPWLAHPQAQAKYLAPLWKKYCPKKRDCVPVK